MFQVVYLVDGGSHEGFHNATVIACNEIVPEFQGAALDNSYDDSMGTDDQPMRQFRWWFAEARWLEVRVESFAREVGSVVDDLPQIEWGYF